MNYRLLDSKLVTLLDCDDGRRLSGRCRSLDALDGLRRDLVLATRVKVARACLARLGVPADRQPCSLHDTLGADSPGALERNAAVALAHGA